MPGKAIARGPVGIFDSGVGGLTVFREVERALPYQDLLYFGDTARVPYGTRSAETVVRYALEATQFMAGHGVSLLVVACNTASSVALAKMAEMADVPVLGVIDPGARRAVSQSESGRIGVIGTRATIDSGAYPRAIRALRGDATVISIACPLFVPLAEEGWSGDAVARQVAERYLAPMKQAAVDTLVLGCTHYPLLRETIAEVMGPAVTLVDSAEAVAEEARLRLEASEPCVGSHAPTHRFFVSDVPGPFQQVAERFLGREIRHIERI